ncbi:hypothetical protein MRX96_020072 [Rhipicephalus microplus]
MSRCCEQIQGIEIVHLSSRSCSPVLSTFSAVTILKLCVTLGDVNHPRQQLTHKGYEDAVNLSNDPVGFS